ncbi:MAG TPA: PAS domain-containing sensor histidine kinase [Methanoregula sp.]|nr:PAS domain-containing sensor histidine kinase [Methanoregula sp.]
MADSFLHIRWFASERDNLLRVGIIALLVTLCTLTTLVAFSLNIDLITTQLFFIPIFYAVYVFPQRGIIVSAICALVYEISGYIFRYPDPVGLTAITIQAVLFVGIAGIIAYLIERIRNEETLYRAVFEYSQLGIVIFSETNEAIRRCNRKFAEMLHFTEAELQKKPLSDLMYSSVEKERFRGQINRETGIDNFEVRLKTKDGSPCWMNLSWSRMNRHTINCTAVNINARKLAEKSGSSNMMKYRQLTENSPVGIIIVQNGAIRYVNPTFSRFMDMPARSLLGKDVCMLVGEPDWDSCREQVKAWEKKTTISTVSMFGFRTAKGELRTAELTTIPIQHFGKAAVLINVIDNTEKQLLKDRIESDNERRRGIMMTVAHELRTPLQPLLGYLNLLIEDPKEAGLTEETRKILERCLASADRERQIINLMLDLSVLDSGKLQLAITRFSLSDLVQNTIDVHGYSTQAEIFVNIPPDTSVEADANRIFIVVESLLSNAMRYSFPPRKIIIDFLAEKDDPFYHLSITDNGVGIPAKALGSIFEPFQLADATSLSRQFDRIGLSLAIAKKIMEIHGGDITVRSTPGTGSTFTLHLPKNVIK